MPPSYKAHAFLREDYFIRFPIIYLASPDGVEIGEALRTPFWLLGSVEDSHFHFA